MTFLALSKSSSAWRAFCSSPRSRNLLIAPGRSLIISLATSSGIGGGGTPDAPAPDEDAPVGLSLELLFILFTEDALLDETSLSGLTTGLERAGDRRAGDGAAGDAGEGRSLDALDGDLDPKVPPGAPGRGMRGAAPTPRGGVGGSLLAGLILAVGGGVPGGSVDGERLPLGDGRVDGAERAGDGSAVGDLVGERRVVAGDGMPEGARSGDGIPEDERGGVTDGDGMPGGEYLSEGASDGEGIPDGEGLSDGDDGDGGGGGGGMSSLDPQRKRMPEYMTDASASALFMSSFA